MYIFNEFCYKEIHLINMSLLDHVNWDFGAIRGAFCCCVGSLSSFYTAAGCDHYCKPPAAAARHTDTETFITHFVCALTTET